MFGIEFKKAPPTVYVMQFENGSIKRAGAGLSFFYFAPATTILDIPLASQDVAFVFNEATADFQEVTIQGQLSYRIADAVGISKIIDFTVNPRGTYDGDFEPLELLGSRLTNACQVIAKGLVKQMTLRKVLVSIDALAAELLVSLRAAEPVKLLGVEILDVSILSIRPTPEMARALEAETRETLQQQADQAIYTRRNAAVEEERRIRESELNTMIAVEQKQRQIRETKMGADIALEEQRQTLIDLQVENDRKDADSKAYALTAALKPVQEVDWRTLMAVGARGGDPRFAISLAFQQLAENANKIGNLTVSPDLLQALLSEHGSCGNGHGKKQ